MNITDVGHLTSDEDDGEDKLQKGAAREGKTAWEVAEFYTDDFLAGMKALNLITPEHITKATEYIPQQINLIARLKEGGYTYQISDGIYFDTAKFPTYANFAHLDIAAQKAGARVEFNPEKRNPSDFALWKFSPKNEQRDMEWETPARILETSDNAPTMGFPGWHIECSTMAMDLLGDTLDIHTGGIDHIPVHHTNEIAQSEAATGKRFSNYWLHNNHLMVNGTKISKSLGNGYTLADLEDHGFSPMDFRMFVLQSHYRSESNFTFDNLTSAKNRLANWRNVAALRHQMHDTLRGDKERLGDKDVVLFATSGAILEAISDDLNTPEALQIIDDAFSRVEGANLDNVHQTSFYELLDIIDALLGLNLLGTTPDITDEQKQRIIERERARENKNWQESDRIRDELSSEGVAVNDTPYGTVWSYA
jgi:cysteinyl-tRNA synthetase